MIPLYGQGDREREGPGSRPAGPADSRSAFRRDYGRIIHCPSFRRLQGKTQLFPGIESDFFRNRLTHSLEVAQVATGIAADFNATVPELAASPIDLDVVQCAALCHDLGHPPFGHTGEAALDECMRPYGGFEGNAQTLRILARLEKKELSGDEDSPVAEGQDSRLGLALCWRTLASVLKYDRIIPRQREEGAKLCKGYYYTEAELVRRMKSAVVGDPKREMKTVECQIMDIADDIAYSTYDLEDVLKGGFLEPLDIDAKPEIWEAVADSVSERTGAPMAARDARGTFREILAMTLQQPALEGTGPAGDPASIEYLVGVMSQRSRAFASNGYWRTRLTSSLVHRFVSGARLKYNSGMPCLSEAYLEESTRREVEVLKTFVYKTITSTSRLKIVELRGKEIVREIFNTLRKEPALLPDDYLSLYQGFGRGGDDSKSLQHRAICDFVAGMTDRYALEFYGRLKSESPQTIFKPL